MPTRIGKYEVRSELGHGAFGRVFRAYDPAMQRSVAIKVLITENENDPDVLARFFLEVQATAKLKHPNIVTIYDFNKTPPYIVMEVVEGESLQQVIGHHASLSLLEKVRILSQAAEGLACAHRNGIVHRDIKPANIMVLPNFDAKIMDFGIARVSGQTEARRTRKGDLPCTFLYISPERIRGDEANACSDIFSFGVVACELITGKHPFEGEQLATVAYKIAHEEVPPFPECPETLNLVVQRAIAKDPEDRYQSGEEILFGLRPVLLELARRQAASVMRGVQGLIDSGRCEEAHARARRALELDPANPEALRVYDAIEKEQQRQRDRKKLDTFLQDGEVQLRQRQFNKAIQSLEGAWRLDTSDTHISDLLGKARAALEANRQAGRLLSEARREMLAGNLEAAYENAAGALKADPQHHDAEVLCEKLRQQIEERDKQLRVEREIRRAEELLARKDFSGARAVLAEVEPEADPDLAGDLRSRIEAEEAEQMRGAREQRVQHGVAKARQQMQANQLAEAGETLRAMLDEFPDATLATKLLAAIGEHIEAQRRAEAISTLTQHALSLMQSQNFLEARRVLESGLRTYPSDAALQRLLDRALDLQRRHERAQAAGQRLEEARKLQASGKIEDALALIGKALAELGPDVALTDLKRQLEIDREQQQYDAGLREALAKGQGLVDAGRFADAVATLEASVALYPGEPEFTSLLASAQHAQAEQEEHQLAAEVVARVGELGSRQQWQDALEGAEEALKRHPYNATLAELTARTRENWRQQQRQYNVARRRGIIEQALASGSLTRAANELQTARQDFPGEQGFDELEERLRQAQVQAQLDSLEQQVRQNLSRGDLDSASRQLTAAQGLADHPRWKALQQELARRQQYQHSLQRARQLNELKDYPAAEELLEQLVRDNPPDKEAAALLHMIRAEQRRVEAERAYRQALEEAGRLRAAGEYHRAQQILQEAVREALDQRAEELLKTVITERGQAERQQQLEQGKKEIRALVDRGAFQKALTAIDKLLGDFSADRELGQLRATAEQQRDLFEALAKIKDLEQRRQFETALDVAESALRTSPENADLVKTAGRLRQAALDQLADTVHSCFAKNDLRRAQAALDGAKKRWGMDPLWQTLQADLERRQAQEAVLREAALAQKQAEQSIWEGRQQAVSLAGKGDLKGALEILEGLCRQYPDHAGLAQDRQAALRKVEVDFVNQTLARITALQGQEKWDVALEEAEKAVERYPKNVELAAIAMQERRRKEIAVCIHDISSTIASHDWSTAEKGLQAAQERFAGERAFERLVQAVRNGRRQEELKDLSSLVERHLFEGRLEEAARETADKKSEFSNEPVWQNLNRQLEVCQAYAKALLDAEQLRREAKHDRAEELLRQAIARGAPDTRAAQLLQSITAERVRKEREKAIARARQEADRLVKEGKLQEALGLLDRICREYPDDFELADHRRDLEARAEKQRQEAQRLEAERRLAAERARKVASCRTAVDAAVAEREWERALQAIDLAERELPGDPAFGELRASVGLERRRDGLEELDRAVRQSFARRDLDGAARQLAAARLDFSEEPLWQSLDEELSRLREYGRLLAEAEDLIVAAKYESAQKKLREAIAIGPADGRAEALLKDIADENNSKRRLALQFRLMVRNYRGIIKWAGIAVVLLLVAGVAIRVFLRPSPVLITLRAEPAEVTLWYRVGQPLPRQIIDFKSAGVKFEVSPTEDWLTVTPQKGDRLGRLEVRVTKALKVGSYADKLLVHANGVTNDPFTIPVRLTVDGVEAPTPVTLKLEREELSFKYTQNDAIPGPVSIRAKQGDIGNATTKTKWLTVEPKTNSVSVGLLLSKDLQQLAVGTQEGSVKVESADPRVHSIDVRVLLMVEAPPKPADLPKVEVPKPVPSPPKEEPKQVTLPVAGPPGGPGCVTNPIVGRSSIGNSTWTGPLEPGRYVDIFADNPDVKGPHPARKQLKIVPQPGISVGQSPGRDNGCGPVRLVNDSKSRVDKIEFRWEIVEK